MLGLHCREEGINILNVEWKQNEFCPPFLSFLFLFCFSSTVGPSVSPSLPPSVPNCGLSSGGAPGIFSFTPANMISAVKQKSAFAPVVRQGLTPPPAGGVLAGLQGGWAHPILSVSKIYIILLPVEHDTFLPPYQVRNVDQLSFYWLKF